MILSTRSLAATLLLFCLVACSDGGSEESAPAESATDQAVALNEGPRAAAVLRLAPERATRGEALFAENSCADCHTLGDSDLAPNLLRSLDRRTLPWLVKQITAPEWMLAHDPITQALFAQYDLEMADMGLSEDAAEDILHYLLRETTAAAE